MGWRWVGIDGAKLGQADGPGWVAVGISTEGDLSQPIAGGRLADLLARPEFRIAERIAIDMPIGLLSNAVPGGRPCEIEARSFLCGPRKSTVFSSPVLAAIIHDDYSAALVANKNSSAHKIGISKQAFALFPRLRECNRLIAQSDQGRIIETHPEVGFAALADSINGQRPSRKKKDHEGAAERSNLLSQVLEQDLDSWLSTRPRGLAIDDLLDALMSAQTARRHANGTALCFPRSGIAWDANNRAMQIWA